MSAAPATTTTTPPSREQLLHMLYEAAELEHNLMCTYLYAAFSLKDGAGDGLSNKEAAAVAGWRKAMLGVAIDEMGHLTAVWNITAAVGGSPRFNRGNFPLDPGRLPASVVVKLAPFSEEVLQHFIYLERPEGSTQEDGPHFAPDIHFRRGISAPRVTPMPIDYETVGAFYTALDAGLKAFVAKWGEEATFCGDPNLQLSATEVDIQGAKPVICLKTATHAFKAIVEQGEGAPADTDDSHFQRFIAIREELAQLKAENPAFKPAFPAAWNPLLRRPVRVGDRVWIENEEAAETVDLANTAYALMLRLMAHSYVVPRPNPVKALAVDLGLGLMRAMTHLAERAVRLPAGPSHPDCNAGMSFSALRDASPFPPGLAANRFFIERIGELSAAADKLAASGDKRVSSAARILADLKKKAERGFSLTQVAPMAAPTQVQSQSSVNGAKPMTNGTQPPANSNTPTAPGTPPTPVTVNGVDHIEGEKLTLLYEGKKCIHSRFCVTGGPKVFIANIEGPWINPDAMDVDRLVEIAHVCPSGAIKYKRKDGRPDETAPPVNLIAIREAGPYAVRADIRLDGEPAGYRLTLCRCGASKHKPFCDGSHHDVPFTATGEPATGKADMLAVRDGVLSIDPQLDGPLQVRGNLEITSGTGRVVSRVTSAKLCRCGGSNTKPFCDGTHAKNGFRST